MAVEEAESCLASHCDFQGSQQTNEISDSFSPVMLLL
jgi:hypothetical protein